MQRESYRVGVSLGEGRHLERLATSLFSSSSTCFLFFTVYVRLDFKGSNERVSEKSFESRLF